MSAVALYWVLDFLPCLDPTLNPCGLLGIDPTPGWAHDPLLTNQLVAPLVIGSETGM